MGGSASDSPPCALTKEMLSFDPLTMVQPPHPSPPMALLELSNMDHMVNFYMRVVLFYKSSSHDQATGGSATDPINSHTRLSKSSLNNAGGDSMDDVATVIRGALQQLLAYYPAAAGRLRMNPHQKRLEVECNDEGVQFVSGHANIALADLGDVSLPHPAMDLLFPTIERHQGERPPILAVQVTRFKCGGFALSLNNIHAYLDGQSAAIFLHNLASIARGDGLSIVPDIVSRRERMKSQSPPKPIFKHPEIVKKGDDDPFDLTLLPPEHSASVTRISFCTKTLEKLRSDVLFGHSYFNACSRYQALIGLLWKAKARSLVQTQLTPRHIQLPIRVVINLRGKVMPNLTQGYVGNGICPTFVSASLQELCESPLHLIVHKIQQAMFSVTPEFVQSMLDYLECGEGPLEASTSPCFFGMTSLVGLPFYDTNFGWGYPFYCGLPSQQMNSCLYILNGDAHGSHWNVVLVLESNEERHIFLETIANHANFST